MTNGSRKLFFKNGRRSNQRKRTLWWRAISKRKLTVDERVKNGMANDSINSMRSSAMSNVLIVLFTFLAPF